jgi:hypothetical protein
VDLVQGSRRVGGRLFSRTLVQTNLMEFENDFFTILEKVQATTDLIRNDFVIRDECGIARTIWQSVNAHARNMEVSIDLIKAVNQCRQEANSSTGNPHLDMPDV